MLGTLSHVSTSGANTLSDGRHHVRGQGHVSRPRGGHTLEDPDQQPGHGGQPRGATQWPQDGRV